MKYMSKTEGAAAVAKLRAQGMSNIQIGETLDRNRNWVGTRITKARELGLLPPKIGRVPMVNLHVFTGDGKRDTDLSDAMCRAVKAAVYEFSGRVPLATAIGVLEIAKQEILNAAD